MMVFIVVIMAILADFKPVQRLVLVGGPDDNWLMPWQSRLEATFMHSCDYTSLFTNLLP